MSSIADHQDSFSPVVDMDRAGAPILRPRQGELGEVARDPLSQGSANKVLNE